jgi:hypothetical protein
VAVCGSSVRTATDLGVDRNRVGSVSAGGVKRREAISSGQSAPARMTRNGHAGQRADVG